MITLLTWRCITSSELHRTYPALTDPLPGEHQVARGKAKKKSRLRRGGVPARARRARPPHGGARRGGVFLEALRRRDLASHLESIVSPVLPGVRSPRRRPAHEPSSMRGRQPRPWRERGPSPQFLSPWPGSRGGLVSGRVAARPRGTLTVSPRPGDPPPASSGGRGGRWGGSLR